MEVGRWKMEDGHPPASIFHLPSSIFHLLFRAGDRTRTGDVQLGKLAFYQLNYARNSSKLPAVPASGQDAGLSARHELRRVHHHPRVRVEQDILGRPVRGNLESLLRLVQLDLLHPDRRRTLRASMTRASRAARAAGWSGRSRLSGRGRIRHDRDLERQAERLALLCLYKLDDDLLRGGIVRPAARERGRRGPMQPLVEEPLQILAGS